MSYSAHESFLDIANSEDVIWRYMDTAKFLSLLQDGALTFASASTMTDTWEGAYSSPVLARLKAAPTEDITAQFVLSKDMLSNVKELIYMSCWHVSPVESAAMWAIYQNEGRGIAIRSTWYKLITSISDTFPLIGGLITYIDYETVDFDPMNTLTAYAFKRRSFEL